MFLALLAVTFIISFAVSFAVARIFKVPVERILNRIIADEISSARLKYLTFAIFVVGISSGVRIHEIEKYITPYRYDKEPRIVELTNDRWILEIYRTIIDTLQGIAWMLLVFFVFALIAYVIVRIFELRSAKQSDTKSA